MIDWSKVIEITTNVVQILAILIGGIWAYFRFVKNREYYAKVKLELDVEYFRIVDSKLFIRVKVKIQNVGSVLIKPKNCFISIDKVIPITESELKQIESRRVLVGDSDDTLLWPTIIEREQNLSEDGYIIEPNESDEIWSDFIIENNAEVLQVYARINSEKEGDGYWGTVKLISNQS